MVDSVDFSKLDINERGRVKFSGISSGIDSAAAIKGILAAKQVPIDRIERGISKNQLQIGALRQLEGYVRSFRDAADALRGKLSLDGSADLFETKQAFTNSFRRDGTAPTAANGLVGVALTNKAQLGTQSIEILQRASAHKVAAAASVTATDPQGVTGQLKLKADDTAITASDPVIEIVASDTLFDIRNKINAANVGTSNSGVTASIISVDSTNSILVLTADDTGQTITFEDTAGDVLGQLGIVSGGNFTSELQPATKAQLRVNNLTDMDAGFISNAFAASTDVIGGGTIVIENLANNETLSIAVSPGADLATAAAEIDGQVFASGAIARAAVEAQADGSYRLRIHAENGGTAQPIALDTTGATAPGEIGATGQFVRPALLVERSSNTISDVFDGMTIDLFKAEPGTTVELRVDRDLQGAKQAIFDFVNKYNELKQFLNLQRQTDETTGEPTDDAVLFGKRIVGDMEAQLGLLFSQGAQGVDRSATVLSQIGIETISEREAVDPLTNGTMTFDNAKFDEAILNNFDAVRSLFSYQFTTTDARVAQLDFNGDTRFAALGVDMTVVGDGSGKIDIAASSVAGSTFDVDGRTITITSGAAKGMKLFYNGDLNNTTPVTINLQNSVGVAHQLFYGMDRILDDEFGIIPAEISVLEGENTLAKSRMDTQLAALDRKRVELEERFTRMEAAMARLASLRQQVASAFGTSGSK